MKVLVVTNESFPDSAPGQKNAIKLLVDKGYLNSVTFFSHSWPKNQKDRSSELISILRNNKFDAILIWSPKDFPASRDEFDQIFSVIGSVPIYYWEGDPWTRTGIKKWTDQMKWWAAEAQIVFTVALEPHTTMFKSITQARIQFIPHTYCHIQFSSAEEIAPPAIDNSNSVVMIGNQSAAIPFVYGTPGSGVRFLLGLSLKYRLREDFFLYGHGWPKDLASGSVAYGSQANLMRTFAMSANWDNFTSHESYASDRLPISLLAGRPHITSSHPGISFYGGEDVGLFEVSNIIEMHKKIDNLRGLDRAKLLEYGENGYKWVKNRFSHREAAQFMFSVITTNVPKLRTQPWINL